MTRAMIFMLITLFSVSVSPSDELPIARKPLFRTVDLDIGETISVELSTGKTVSVKLVSVKEFSDDIQRAVRSAKIVVELEGREIEINSANYQLPIEIDNVQIDCPITKGYYLNTRQDSWGLVKDARVRLWPAGSPWIRPESFVYPVQQRWFATLTQMANEPTYVDGGEAPSRLNIYYHSGLDIGGTEGRVQVVSATEGYVISSGTEILPGYDDAPVQPRYDVIYLRDKRGWYYRYSHLKTINDAIRPGRTVAIGQRLGILGKEGGSGGWSHLHFEIKSKQPSGKFGTEEGYAFLWQVYMRENDPPLIAVARPHHFTTVGQSVQLDGSKSISRVGKIIDYEWEFTDGTKATGPIQKHTYSTPGSYSEILKVTDDQGNEAYDFAEVQVIDPEDYNRLPPTIHPTFYPTTNIEPGTPIVFGVRSFRTMAGNEIWDFGDGSPTVSVQSDGNKVKHAPDGYAQIVHGYKNPGDYIVTARHTNEHDLTAIGHLYIHVGERGSATVPNR